MLGRASCRVDLQFVMVIMDNSESRVVLEAVAGEGSVSRPHDRSAAGPVC
jgi:hypothetical protein